MKTVKVVKSVVARVADLSTPLTVGMVVKVPEDDADNLVRGKYAEYVKGSETGPVVDIIEDRKAAAEKRRAMALKKQADQAGGIEDNTL